MHHVHVHWVYSKPPINAILVGSPATAPTPCFAQHGLVTGYVNKRVRRGPTGLPTLWSGVGDQ
ncbi:hypothetical protein HaLaN_13762 [Haematococcus lacustris]|uniref:Uncharacterized protein n=1 Tax=Haematococcus lacustris TaxID=44745 RepID=A0A699ZDD4_HAELA|nr:hypothetical protein HaLaN_13762 [Haematococcus lacustris]